MPSTSVAHSVTEPLIRGFGDVTRVDDAVASLSGSLAPSTVLAYARWWKRWRSWCAVNGFRPLPAHADTLERFVAELASDGTTPSGIRQAIGAVRAAHRTAGFRDHPPRLRGTSERGAAGSGLGSQGRA